ncbi:MAG: hypothetical protein V4736_10225 [Bdellovibrionota bacterium]
MELAKPEFLNKEQIAMIKEHLDLAFAPPAYNFPQNDVVKYNEELKITYCENSQFENTFYPPIDNYNTSFSHCANKPGVAGSGIYLEDAKAAQDSYDNIIFITGQLPQGWKYDYPGVYLGLKNDSIRPANC